MKPRSGFRQRLFYSIGQIGDGAYNGLNIAILPLFVSGFTSNPFIIGYLGNTRTLEGVVIQPLVGRWSDKTTSRLGRRRPFILFSVPISVLFLILIPLTGHASQVPALPLIAAAIILFSTTWNVGVDPYKALMIDITPLRERPVFNAILSVISLVGQIAIVMYASFAALKKNAIPDAVFYATAAVLLVTFAAVFFGVHEPPGGEELAEVENRIPLRTYLREMRVFTEAFKLLTSIFFLWTGLNAFEPFISILPIKVVHATKSQSLIVYVVLILSAALFSYPFGRLAARYGTRRFIVVGTGLLIAAALWGLIVPTYFWFFPLAIVAGAGFSATTVLTYPYLSQLVPESRIGVFTGLQTAASAIALPIGVVAVGALIDHFGYRSVFALLAASMLLDVLFLLLIDEKAAHRQVVEVEEAELLVAREQPLPAT